MKIHSVGAELFHADGDRQTGMKKLMITLSKSANTTKKQAQQYQAIPNSRKFLSHTSALCNNFHGPTNRKWRQSTIKHTSFSSP